MNKSIKILANYFLGPVLFIVLSWSLYRQVISQPNLSQRWEQIKEGWIDGRFVLVFVLMFLNWGIEARKWQLLIKQVQPFSFFNAFKSVFAGSSVTMLTPNRVGEYGGRIFYIDEGNRIKAISLAVVGSISQLLVTLLMGCAGLFFLRFFLENNPPTLMALPQFWIGILLYISAGSTIVLLLFYLRIGWLVRIMEKVTALKKVVRHIKVLDEFNHKKLWQVLFLSLLRYLVFVLQYILLLKIMHVDIEGLVCFWLVTVFYLVLAIAPTIGFVELPIRVRASWEVFRFYSSNELGIGTAALGIWLINLVVPAIIGSLLILSVKIVKEK